MGGEIKKPVKKINVENASIKTATVEIKAIMVNARKMTLSVFRQIQEECIIDQDTFELKGIPWGHVNYYWKDEEGDLHVLWQKGNELRRSLLMYKSGYYIRQRFEKRCSDINLYLRIDVADIDSKPTLKICFLYEGIGRPISWNLIEHPALPTPPPVPEEDSEGECYERRIAHRCECEK